MLWWIGSALIAAWFILKVIMNRGGWAHLLLLSGLTILVVQVAAYRKTNYQKGQSDK